MANTKKWSFRDYLPIVEYLHNTVTTGEVILKLRDRKGVRRATIKDEVELAVRALQIEMSRTLSWENKGSTSDFLVYLEDDYDFDEDKQSEFNAAVENWINEYLVEGGRAKLLNALRVREHRAEQVETTVPIKAQKRDKQPIDRIDQLVKLLRKYTKQEIELALSRMGETLR